jgi:NADH:ubiquinone oxidoreductase subunit 3 (subunit A)
LLVESAIAFILIVAAAAFVYQLGRRAAPKTVQTQGERSVYACGEKVAYSKLKVNVPLYRYLIYFVILDSSVMLIAFALSDNIPASFMGQTINIPLILLYLFMMLASSLLLFEGGKD